MPGTFAAAALATLIPLAGLPASNAADDEVHATWRSAIVEGPVIQLGWLAGAPISALYCPDTADTLERREFHAGSGWRIPRGVELRTGGSGLDVSIMEAIPLGDGQIVKRDGVGGWHSSVTNWTLADNWVQVVLHCTNQR
jgi:hypothetical protein